MFSRKDVAGVSEADWSFTLTSKLCHDQSSESWIEFFNDLESLESPLSHLKTGKVFSIF